MPRFLTLESRCGDSITVVHPLFQEEGGSSILTSPLQLVFCKLEVKRACELNAVWHSRLPKIDWSNVVRNTHYICYGAEYANKYYAVAIWSTPVAANRMKDGNKMLELRRMAISGDAPKNTASRMLGWMVRDIRKRFPDIAKLVSYQDTEVHRGTIYKATGWVLDGETKFLDWSTTKRKRQPIQSSANKNRWTYTLRQMGEIGSF